MQTRKAIVVGDSLQLDDIRYIIEEIEQEDSKGGMVVRLTLRRPQGKVLYETVSYFGGEFSKPWRKHRLIGWHMEIFAFSMKELAERTQSSGGASMKTEVICCVCDKHLRWIQTPCGGVSHGYCKKHFEEAVLKYMHSDKSAHAREWREHHKIEVKQGTWD